MIFLISENNKIEKMNYYLRQYLGCENVRFVCMCHAISLQVPFWTWTICSLLYCYCSQVWTFVCVCDSHQPYRVCVSVQVAVHHGKWRRWPAGRPAMTVSPTLCPVIPREWCRPGHLCPNPSVLPLPQQTRLGKTEIGWELEGQRTQRMPARMSVPGKAESGRWW